MSIGYGFQCLGMTIGPLIQAALSPLQGSEPSTESYISFDMFTAAGYYFTTTLVSLISEQDLINKQELNTKVLPAHFLFTA